MNITNMLKGFGVLALTTLGFSAQAAVITYSTDFNLASTDPLKVTTVDTDLVVTDSVVVNLDRFDNSLGHLQAVNIWFESDWNLSSTVTAFDIRDGLPRASARGKSISLQSARIIDPYRDIQNNREVVRSTCSDLLLCISTVDDSGTFNDSFDLSSFMLSDFIGTDSLRFRFRRNLTSDLLSCGTQDICEHINSNNAWSGRVYVSYQVPEPSTLMLLGLGFLGLGAKKLRSRYQ